MPSRMRLAAACLTLVIIGSSLQAQEGAFCDAVSNGELETARALLKSGDATSVDPFGQRRPLALALFVKENSRPLVELLLRRGADPKRRGEAGISPFVVWTGVRDPEAPAKLGLLLQHGAEIDSVGNGLTALINAARFCNIEVRSLLLEHGANPNGEPRGQVNKTSWAALHYVAGGPAVQGTAEDALESARLLIAGGGRRVHRRKHGCLLGTGLRGKGVSDSDRDADAFAREKLNHMEILGARLEIVPSDSRCMTEKLTRDMIDAAATLARKPGSFWTDQLNNTDPLPAYRRMGEEIWTQTDGRIDGFVQSVGTAGSIRGVGEALRRHNESIRVVAVEPSESAVLSGGATGAHKIDGIGAGFVVPLWRDDIADGIE